MKRSVIIECLLLLTTSILIFLGSWYLNRAHVSFVHANGVPEDIAPDILSSAYRFLTHGLLALLAALCTLAAMIMIAIKDFPCFKPLIDKFKARREAKAEAKTEKAVADKQARIEQLQAELNELKKDE